MDEHTLILTAFPFLIVAALGFLAFKIHEDRKTAACFGFATCCLAGASAYLFLTDQDTLVYLVKVFAIAYQPQVAAVVVVGTLAFTIGAATIGVMRYMYFGARWLLILIRSRGKKFEQIQLQSDLRKCRGGGRPK